MKNLLTLLAIFFGLGISLAQYDYKKDHNDSDFKLAENYRLKNKDKNKAYPVYLKLATKGNAAAMNQLGWLLYDNSYISGKRNENHKKDALSWFQKASEKGNGDAMCSIGWLHLQFDNTVTNDNRLATDWFRKGAEAGSARAMRWYANRVSTGDGTDRDVPKAVNLWLKASGMGDPLASSDLGDYYYREKNYTDALSYYKKAYQQGNFNATSNIVEIYRNGLGVEKNQSLVDEWKNKPFVDMDTTK